MLFKIRTNRIFVSEFDDPRVFSGSGCATLKGKLYSASLSHQRSVNKQNKIRVTTVLNVLKRDTTSEAYDTDLFGIM